MTQTQHYLLYIYGRFFFKDFTITEEMPLFSHMQKIVAVFRIAYEQIFSKMNIVKIKKELH